MDLKFVIISLIILSSPASASIIVDTYNIYNNFYLCWKYTAYGWISENTSMATTFPYNSTNPLSSITITCFKGENTTTELLIDIYSSGMIRQRNYTDYLLCSSKISSISTNAQDIVVNFTECNLQANQSYIMHITSPGAPYEYDKMYACSFMYTCTNLYPDGQYYQLFLVNDTGWCMGSGSKCWHWVGADLRYDMLFRIEDIEPMKYNLNIFVSDSIKPIENATVILTEGTTCYTDINGICNLTLNQGIYNLTITKDGYKPVNDVINLTQNTSRNYMLSRYLADIKVSSLNISNSTPSENANLSITAVIENSGDLDANNVTTKFLLDGNLSIWNEILNLPANSSATLSANWTAIFGIHNITVIADSENIIEENNETNNNATIQINVFGIPDLMLNSSDIFISSVNPIEGQNLTINATIWNIGNLDALNFTVLFLIGNRTISNLPTNLSINSSLTLLANWTAEYGNHRLSIAIDPENQIYESNESNNNASIAVDVSSAYCRLDTWVNGTVKRNLNPLENIKVQVNLGNNSVGENFTDLNGNYRIFLNLNNYSATEILNAVFVSLDIPYIEGFTISCGENKTIDVILGSIGEQERPIIYTTTKDGKIERVFKSGDKVYITVVLKNPMPDKKVSEKLEILVTDESGKIIDKISEKNVNLKPNEIKTIKESWNSKDYAKQNLSGFEFIGRKFFIKAEFGSTHAEYGFYVDEFGVPEWLRNNVELHLGDQFRDVVDKAKSKEEVLDYYRNMMNYANSTGFTSVLFHHYYGYGYNESHEKSEINYWFPAGENPDTHYYTPYSSLVKLAGNEEKAQNLIKQLVKIAHDNNLKVIAYIDPMAIYSPDETGKTIDPNAVGHYNAETEGFAAMDSGGKPIRANFLETKWLISDINHLAVQVSPCGPAKSGLASDDNAFSPSKISSDLNSDWTKDPSHHYQTVKEVNWLIENYGFDGISTDDTGRLIMAGGQDILAILIKKRICSPVSYVDDLWTCLMYPAKPTKSLYGISEDRFCQELRGDQNKDYFAMDSFANMIKHIRWQIKDSNPEKILISNDYFVPSDVDWKSIISSEDVSASDQFNIVKPSFARWAYLTYNDGYKALRNDLRRTTLTLPKTETPPIFVEPISEKAIRDRPHLLRGVLLATSWANKVHSEILFDELNKTQETEELLKSYVDMRRKIPLPIYSSEVEQELLYHSNLKESSGFKSNPELKPCWGDFDIFCPNYLRELTPYDAILYRIPSDYGEKARILHVINSRVATTEIENEKVPMDYYFRIRIPYLEEVQGVYLVSADLHQCLAGNITDPDRDCIEDLIYTANITSKTDLWHTENNYLYLKLPQVITSTISYIEFKPKNLTGKSIGTQAIYDKNGRIQKLQQLDLKPVKERESINQSLQVGPEDNSLSLSLRWGGSDLDMHLYSPSGKHSGYNYSSNSTDLVQNSAYTSTNTTESISVQNPESGNWTIQVYGKNVSQQYNETGEPYSLGISLQGNYKPNLTAGISAKTATLNESASLPVSIRNIGSATAYNLSALFYSNSFNITENITLQSLESDISLNTEINALPLAVGNASVYLNLSYSDSEGNRYNLSNSTIMQIVTNPRLYLYLDYSPVNPTTTDIIRFNINLTNIGSSTAYRINLTTQLDSGINATTPANFSISNLSAGQSANFSFNAKASAGRFYARAYAYYESQNGSLFLAGSNEAEIRVSETTTTTLPSPPTTLPPTPPEQPPEVTTTTTTTTLTTTSTLPPTITTTTTISLTTTTQTTPTSSTSTITTITTSSTLTTTTQTTTTSTTLITTTTTTTLPDIHPPEILKSFSEIDGKKVILQLLTDEISVCKYDAEDTAYDEMKNIFTESNGTVHRESLKLHKGTYTFYARCTDIFGNVDKSSVIFRFTINATTSEKVSTPLPVSEEIILCKNDGVRNYAETGVDCGGPCKPCLTTTTVRTTTTTTRVTVTSLTTTSTVTTSTTTTTLTKAPNIIGRIVAFSGKRSSEIMLIATILLLTAGLVYYLRKGGKKG